MFNLEVYKNKMRSLKMTQIELSEKSGVPLATLRCIFSKRVTNPRVETILAIEKALNIEDDSLAKPYLTEDEERLLSLFRQLPNTRKKTILDTMSDMVSARKLSEDVS